MPLINYYSNTESSLAYSNQLCYAKHSTIASMHVNKKIILDQSDDECESYWLSIESRYCRLLLSFQESYIYTPCATAAAGGC